jgi:hypothetical protein
MCFSKPDPPENKPIFAAPEPEKTANMAKPKKASKKKKNYKPSNSLTVRRPSTTNTQSTGTGLSI